MFRFHSVLMACCLAAAFLLCCACSGNSAVNVLGDGDEEGSDRQQEDGDESISDGDDRPSDGDEVPDDGDITPPDGDPILDGDELPDGDQPEDGDDAPDGDMDEDVDGDRGDGEEAPADGDTLPGECDFSDWDGQCPENTDFEYTCNAADPLTCPGGYCLLGLCIGPVLDADRWADCGNGCCHPCEDEETCPADCGELPEMTGEKEYDNDSTISIELHGWSNSDPTDKTYGYDRGCGGGLEDMYAFGIDREVYKCSSDTGGSDSPKQFSKMEYFGDTPADWLTEEQIAEVEQYPLFTDQILHRYALISAMFIRHKLTVSGATHVNIFCHSYGCLLTRYIIENNLENLSAENRIVRWHAASGVLAGARLARLYDNPGVQDIANLIGLTQADFVVMNPDFVADHAASWDHKVYELNNPLFKGILVNHQTACDPRIAQAINIQLLDLNNPGDEPNDGIMYSWDTFFHEQAYENRFIVKSGERIKPTVSYVYVDHMAVPDTDANIALGAAALFHKRKVFIKVKEVHLIDDMETGGWGGGVPPAEILVQSKVRFNPYLQDSFGKNILIHDTQYAYRTPAMFTMYEGAVYQPDLPVFEGPVFDQMEELSLNMSLLEVDYFKRENVLELPLGLGDLHEEIISFTGQVPLEDHEFEVENARAKMTLEVKVLEMY